MARDDNMIAGLRRERAVYAARGDDERVSQVDEQLAHYGYTPEHAEDDGPQGRTSADPGKKTAAKKAVAPPRPKG
ncbi:hypothetical protein ABZ208_35385 [Streptomyces sp. NPDC006208]|uniref:hypothetical protein n=1 Tax=Streptomyces sp. NPDC006208 TaxID=3156734 RepID=UPI00339F6919